MKSAWTPLAVVSLVLLPTISFAGEKVIVVGGWDYGEAVFARAAADLGMTAEFVTTEDTGKVTTEQLTGADVVFLLNLQPQGAATLQERLAEVRKKKPALAVLPLDQRETQKGIEKAGLLARDDEIRRYWRYNGFENTKRLLTYVRVKHLGGKGEIQPPVPVPECGLYFAKAPDLFAEVPAFIEWAKKNGQFKDSAPRVALLVQQSFLVTGDTKVYDAITAAFVKRGVNVAVIFAHDPAKQKALLDAWNPELLIDDAHASPSLQAGPKPVTCPCSSRWRCSAPPLLSGRHPRKGCSPPTWGCTSSPKKSTGSLIRSWWAG